MKPEDLGIICLYCKALNKGKLLKKKDVDDIYKALSEFNGED